MVRYEVSLSTRISFMQRGLQLTVCDALSRCDGQLFAEQSSR
jgi:hypothetical protein